MTEPTSKLKGALFLVCLLACEAGWAQPAPQPSAVASAAERAQRETDRTMYWIRVLADKPAPTRVAAAPVAKPAVAVAAAPARPTRVALATTSGGTSSLSDSPKVASAPAMVGQASSQPLAPYGDSPDSSALSSSGADSVAATPEEPASAAEPDPGLTQIKAVQPEFPLSVVQRVRKGNVEVRFDVDTEGVVVDATVVGSSHPRLNDAAVEAVKQWRFKPTSKAHAAMVNLVFNIDTEN